MQNQSSPLSQKNKHIYGYCLMLACLILQNLTLFGQERHIYLANDNHTDLFWSGTAAEYRTVALHEIDYYLDQVDKTKSLPAPFQSRYNLDGAWYAYVYQQNKSVTAFDNLLDRIRSGHISLPYNMYVSTYGGQPTEAVLRGMYWPGRLERDYGLDLKLAVAMENQTLPLGLASLWAGSGAHFSWKGVCGCSSPVSSAKLRNRNHQIYRYTGLDGTGVVMKWYDLSNSGNESLGGYAEARIPSDAVAECEQKINTTKYPYLIAGAFGYGWDDLEATTDIFTREAQALTTSNRKVYVSNEADFFEHFLNTYGEEKLPQESVTYGNDWDMDCAALAPITTKIRNSVEKLRTAEALASVAALVDPAFYPSKDPQREQAWVALGSFWEHNFGMGGCCYEERGDWEIELQHQVTAYVDRLYQTSLDKLANGVITNSSSQPRFMVFNGLGWPRTAFADIPYSGSAGIVVTEVGTGVEAPYQIITRNNVRYLRILAAGVPSLGYKVFEIRPGTPASLPNAATLNGRTFENSFYRLRVTPEGVITSLIDKMNGNREYVMAKDGRFLNDFGQEDGEAGTLTLLDNGPVSATIACTSDNLLKHTTLITLYRDLNRIDIENRIADDFGDDIRTYAFSFNVNNPTVWHEELGAVIKAKYTSSGGHYATSDQAVRHDWQTLNHFADVGNGTAGITLSNQGAAFMKLGNSTTDFLDQSSAQVNVLIGGRMSGSGPGFANQFGLKEFDNAFALRSRSGEFKAEEAMQFALEHQNPFAVKMLAMVPQGDKKLPEAEFSLLAVSNPRVLLWALKPAEEGVANGGFVLRLWNMAADNQSATVAFATKVLDAYHTTHLETNLEPATKEAGKLSTLVGKQKLDSYRVELDAYSMTTAQNPVAKDALAVEIFPNPASDSINIHLPQGASPVRLTVYNAEGKQVATRNLNGPATVLEVKGWDSGVYIFSFENQQSQGARKIIIK